VLVHLLCCLGWERELENGPVSANSLPVLYQALMLTSPGQKGALGIVVAVVHGVDSSEPPRRFV